MRASSWRPFRPALAALVFCALSITAAGCDSGDPVERLVSQAAALYEAGNLPEAIIKLNGALAQTPASIPARVLAAKVYIDLGQGDAALGALKRARQDGASEASIAKLRAEADILSRRYEEAVSDTADPPDDLPNAVRASLLANRGTALRALGRTAEAVAAFQQGLRLDPRSVDVRIASARMAVDNGDFDAAHRGLAEATQEAPNERGLKQLEGDIAYAARDYAAAEAIYQQIISSAPWNQLARGDLAASQIAQNKLSEAAANLDTILEDADLSEVPKDPMLLYLRAIVSYNQKDYVAAQSNAENVVLRASAFGPARLIAGASSFALHQYERAYYYTFPYVSNNPGDIRAIMLLAQIQLELNRPSDAARTLSPLRNEAMDDPDLLRLIGVAASRSGDAAGAERYLGLALEQRPSDPALRTELGRAKMAAGDPKTAIGILDQVAKAHPDEIASRIPLFVAAMQTREFDKALTIADQIIAINPDSPTGYLLASSAHLSQGNVEAGRAALLKARQIRQGDINANANLARLAIAEGKTDDARGYYRDTLEANPQSAATYLALAELDARTGNYQEAEAVLLKGVQANPDDASLIVGLLKLQWIRGNVQEAVAGGERALNTFPRNPALLDIVGSAQLALGQHEAALSTFANLVNVAPKAARAHAALAEAYMALYTPQNPQWPAINEATEAVRLDPQGKAPKLVLARALIMHRRFDEASKVVDALKGGDPQAVDVIELEGLLARGQGRLEDAIAAFSRAISVLDNAVDRSRLADTQAQLGRQADAIATLETWLRAHADDSKSQAVLAGFYMNAGRLDDARAQYLSLVAGEPKNAMLQNNLAWILLQLGQIQEAVDHARAAVALAPQSADFLDTLGDILVRNGNPAEAVELLDKAWQEDPAQGDIGFHLSEALAGVGRKEDALALLRRLLEGNGRFTARNEAQDLLRRLGG